MTLTVQCLVNPQDLCHIFGFDAGVPTEYMLHILREPISNPTHVASFLHALVQPVTPPVPSQRVRCAGRDAIVQQPSPRNFGVSKFEKCGLVSPIPDDSSSALYNDLHFAADETCPIPSVGQCRRNTGRPLSTWEGRAVVHGIMMTKSRSEAV